LDERSPSFLPRIRYELVENDCRNGMSVEEQLLQEESVTKNNKAAATRDKVMRVAAAFKDQRGNRLKSPALSVFPM
jgi:hypothetical protein